MAEDEVMEEKMVEGEKEGVQKAEDQAVEEGTAETRKAEVDKAVEMKVEVRKAEDAVVEDEWVVVPQTLPRTPPQRD